MENTITKEEATKLKQDTLEDAIRKGDLKAVRGLMVFGVDLNNTYFSNLYTPLMYAAKTSFTTTSEMVKILLDNGANVNIGDEYGWTALHSACEYGPKLETVKILLNAGANVNVKAMNDSQNPGITPLHLAVFHYTEEESIDVVRLLLEAGADVNAQESKDSITPGVTPLHRLCFQLGDIPTMDPRDISQIMNINIKILELLIEADANLNLSDSYGNTALSYVAMDAFDAGEYAVKVVKKLIENGATINYKDFQGKTILEKLEEYGKEKFIEIEKMKNGEIIKVYSNDKYVENGDIFIKFSADNYVQKIMSVDEYYQRIENIKEVENILMYEK